TDEILDGTILPADINSAGNDLVLTTDASGNVQWQSQGSLSSSQQGDGLVYDATNEEIDVNPDNSTLEVDNDILRVKAEGITANEIGTDAVLADEIATGAVTTDEILDATIQVGDVAPGTGAYVMTTNPAGTAVQWQDPTTLGLDDHDWYDQANPGSAPTDIDDDIYTQGNVGIGTTAPSATLDVEGSLQFDLAGTEVAGSVLTSDASGNATWSSQSIAALFNKPLTGGGTISWDGTTFTWSKRIIALPAGSGSGTHISANPTSIAIPAWNVAYMRPTDAQFTSGGNSGVTLNVEFYTTYVPDEKDIIVAVHNGEAVDGMLYTAWGVILADNESYSASAIGYNRNIGIGTDVPEKKLNIETTGNGDGILITRDAATNAAGMYFNYSTPATDVVAGIQADRDLGGSNNGGIQILAANGRPIQFYTKGGQSGSYLTDTEEAMRIHGDGNVGIGTNAPASKLQVTGDEVRIGNAGTVDFAAGDGDLYVEDALEVDGIAYVDDYVFVGNGNENALIFEDAGGDNTIRHTVNDGNGNYNIMLGVDGDAKYTVTNDGASKILMTGHGGDGEISLNVGPQGTVGNTVAYTMGLSLDAADLKLRIGASDNVGLDGGAGNIIADVDGVLYTDRIRARSATGLRITDDANNLGMFVEDGGDVGVGTATPDATLDVVGTFQLEGNGAALGNVLVSDASGNASWSNQLPDEDDGYIWNQTSADQSAGFRIDGDGLFSSGNVGIGTTSPSNRLDIASQART
ncbi:MAG: hypothetical protein GY746_07720, partial [Gammaproteobacteria bacterium]|nr:hypothetical protein [Gammaproteobacteria bacterium]